MQCSRLYPSGSSCDANESFLPSNSATSRIDVFVSMRPTNWPQLECSSCIRKPFPTLQHQKINQVKISENLPGRTIIS